MKIRSLWDKAYDVIFIFSKKQKFSLNKILLFDACTNKALQRTGRDFVEWKDDYVATIGTNFALHLLYCIWPWCPNLILLNSRIRYKELLWESKHKYLVLIERDHGANLKSKWYNYMLGSKFRNIVDKSSWALVYHAATILFLWINPENWIV